MNSTNLRRKMPLNEIENMLNNPRNFITSQTKNDAGKIRVSHENRGQKQAPIFAEKLRPVSDESSEAVENIEP